jgi:hypothetical protein
MFISLENEVSVMAKAGFVGLKRNGNGKKQKKGHTAPHGAGTMNNRIVGGGVLARAAQQRKQLRAQRQTRDERACEGKK